MSNKNVVSRSYFEKFYDFLVKVSWIDLLYDMMIYGKQLSNKKSYIFVVRILLTFVGVKFAIFLQVNQGEWYKMDFSGEGIFLKAHQNASLLIILTTSQVPGSPTKKLLTLLLSD